MVLGCPKEAIGDKKNRRQDSKLRLKRNPGAWERLTLQSYSRVNEISRKSKEGLALNDRAGLGDVGVKRFDGLAIVFFDDAAFQFHGESESAIVEGEVLR
jgi:hypothetical protein